MKLQSPHIFVTPTATETYFTSLPSIESDHWGQTVVRIPQHFFQCSAIRCASQDLSPVQHTELLVGIIILLSIPISK